METRPTRILHVAQPVEAGVPTVVRDLVARQVDRGCAVAVACPPSGSLPQWVQDAGAELLPWHATRAPGPSMVREWFALRAHIRRFGPDLVHLHSSKAGLIGRLVVRGREPTVYQPHAWSFLAVRGIVRQLAMRWERLGARWTDILLCVSPGEAATGRAVGVRGRRVVCVNGVDLTRFAPIAAAARDTLRASLGLPPGLIVLCVGRLCEQKGQDLLISAWRRLSRSDAVLVLVGDGPDRQALERSAGPGVVFVGNVADIAPWYSAADLAVAPSRWEGASLVTREVMASGLSQVATDVDGARDAVDDAGAVVPIEDVDALADAIRVRLDDPQLRHAEGQRARAIADELFDIQVALQQVDRVYENVLDKRRAR